MRKKDILSNDSKEEYIICASIHFNDHKWHPHQPKNIIAGVVISGRRHHNCFATLSALRIDRTEITSFGERPIQGFLTSKDRFVDRKEAGEIAFKAKQINKLTDMLFSEDLY